MKAKLPPHDLDAERSVLAAILIDTDAIVKVTEFVEPESFYAPENRIIFTAMRELYERREPIDVVTLTAQLKKNKQLPKAGGAAELTKLSNLLSTPANVTAYAQLVREHFIKRTLISLASEVSDLALDAGGNVKDLLDLV